MDRKQTAKALSEEWQRHPRWAEIRRPYTAESVVRLSGSLRIVHTLAKLGAEKLWHLFQTQPFVRAMGALTGNQAVQQVQAGLQAIYVSGWQVAGDANDADQTYPDQSLYPLLSVPRLIRRIQNALQRADEVQYLESEVPSVDWFVPVVADAEAGFGGPLNAFELIKAMIMAGAAAIHLEDQLSSIKKCGHMGGKVLVPASLFIEKLVTARLASDVLGVPTVLIARTDAESATYIRSDSDPIDQPFLTGQRSVEGYFHLKQGTEYAIARALAFAPYSDMIWCETSKPDLGAAQEFAKGIHAKFPGKWLAYNCSPSFNWSRHLDEIQIRTFQEKLADMGYKFQFITLAGFHTLNASMFELAHAYATQGMTAYRQLQQREQDLERAGYQGLKHQRFVGAGYFDEVLTTITSGKTSTQALKGSTEEQQF
jgi:isocitrate lyase